jgi:hypothetical protein
VHGAAIATLVDLRVGTAPNSSRPTGRRRRISTSVISRPDAPAACSPRSHAVRAWRSQIVMDVR